MMRELLKPIKSESLIDVFIKRFEELILSGKISIGQRFPSERELALQLGVSRPVVHEGLVELESKGLVTMRPRAGCVVNDFRRNGSLALLKSLVEFSSGALGPEILDGMLKMRILFETETAALAAENRTVEHLAELNALIEEEEKTDRSNIEKIVSLDFRFHLSVAISSGNLVYPLMLNSFKEVYTNLTRVFFKEPAAADFVFQQHRNFFRALESGNKKSCVKIMTAILKHGESHLRKILSDKKNNRR